MTQGIEWLVEARGCDPARLSSPELLAALFDEIVGDLGLNVVGTPGWHKFPGYGGVTGFAILAESHLSVHTFPEHHSLCLNLFCCRARAEWPWRDRLAAHVGAEEVQVRRVERNYCHSERSEESVVGALQIPHFVRDDTLTRT